MKVALDLRRQGYSIEQPNEIQVSFIGCARGTIVNALGDRMHQVLVRLLEEESGQNQLEFALVAALLSLSAVATLKGLAADVTWLWQGLAANLASAI